MVKRQKEKQYQSAQEYRTNSQLRSGTKTTSSTTRRLPFKCCALSLLPFQEPVCTQKGIIFENSIITPHILKYKTDPITGEELSTTQLIKLNMHKNDDNVWECPILNKAFNDFTKVVAVKISPNEANVYSYEAVYELNIKLKNWEDLVSSVKFTKKDLIVLQDPNDEDHERLRDICNFYHIKNSKVDDDGQDDGGGKNIRANTSIARIMDKLADNQNKRKLEESDTQKQASTTTTTGQKSKVIYACDITGINETIGKCSGSFTSTSLNITSQNTTFREATTEEIIEGQLKMLSKLKKKGYVRIHTTCGILDVELHCDYVPRTTFNFLQLCKEGKYDRSFFHRLIPGFMIQGGKPKDEEGGSIWGKGFKDEFHAKLSHDEKGILSMANSGPDTNGSQFFITFRDCIYLDNKHSIFGRVIKGLDVLSMMEKIPTHTHGKKKDRPKKNLCIEKVEILVNPVEEAIALEEARVQENYEKRMKESRIYDDSLKNKVAKTNVGSDCKTSSGAGAIGKYLPNRDSIMNKKW